MREVILKELSFQFFKGFRNKTIQFSENESFIIGANEAGKTTVFDGLWFLFFGKDSSGRAEFSIKTRNEDGTVIEKVDHSVSGLFLIDGKPKEFKRVLTEVWTKSTDTLKGNTTNYFIDGFEVTTEKEFKAEIAQLFTEEIFKLLTNPLYFNGLLMKERREKLLELAPKVTDQQIFDAMPAHILKIKGFSILEKYLADGRSLNQIRAKVSSDLKTLKESKSEFKPRIDEAERTKPEPVDIEHLNRQIEAKKRDISKVEKEINDLENDATSKNKVLNDWQDKIQGMKRTLSNLEFEASQLLEKAKREQGQDGVQLKSKIDSLMKDRTDLTTELTRINTRVEGFKSQIKTLTRLIDSDKQDQDKIRSQWNSENSKEFSWDGKSCGACNRPFEGEQAAQLEEKARSLFNTEKANNLKDIESKGKRIGEKILSNEKEIAQINEQIEVKEKEALEVLKKRDQINEDIITLEAALNEFNSTPQQGLEIEQFLSPEAVTIKGQIEALEAEKPEEIKPDTAALQLEKERLKTELEEKTKSLGKQEEISRIDERINQLKIEEKNLSDQIAEVEGIEAAAMEYSKAKISLIEGSINDQFRIVRFEMFDKKMNGNEVECCDTIFKGVPWPDVNTAGQTQSGLDIIHAFSKHYGIKLPIFIDNRESISEIPEMNTQIINLVVNPEVKELKIVSRLPELV